MKETISMYEADRQARMAKIDELQTAIQELWAENRELSTRLATVEDQRDRALLLVDGGQRNEGSTCDMM